jgi:hypothetical protein
MINPFLGIFFLPFSYILLNIDLKQGLLSGFILGKLSNLKVKIRLHDSNLLLPFGTFGAAH